MNIGIMHVMPAVENALEDEEVFAVELYRARAFTVGLLREYEAFDKRNKRGSRGCHRSCGNDHFSCAAPPFLQIYRGSSADSIIRDFNEVLEGRDCFC